MTPGRRLVTVAAAATAALLAAGMSACSHTPPEPEPDSSSATVAASPQSATHASTAVDSPDTPSPTLPDRSSPREASAVGGADATAEEPNHDSRSGRDSAPAAAAGSGEAGPSSAAQEPTVDWCSPQGMARSGLAQLTSIDYCDGAWARAGQPNTDDVRILRLTGDGWQEYPAHGKVVMGLAGPCYVEQRAQADGMPAYLVGKARLCAEDSAVIY